MDARGGGSLGAGVSDDGDVGRPTKRHRESAATQPIQPAAVAHVVHVFLQGFLELAFLSNRTDLRLEIELSIAGSLEAVVWAAGPVTASRLIMLVRTHLPAGVCDADHHDKDFRVFVETFTEGLTDSSENEVSRSSIGVGTRTYSRSTTKRVPTVRPMGARPIPCTRPSLCLDFLPRSIPRPREDVLSQLA